MCQQVGLNELPEGNKFELSTLLYLKFPYQAPSLSSPSGGQNISTRCPKYAIFTPGGSSQSSGSDVIRHMVRIWAADGSEGKMGCRTSEPALAKHGDSEILGRTA